MFTLDELMGMVATEAVEGLQNHRYARPGYRLVTPSHTPTQSGDYLTVECNLRLERMPDGTLEWVD